MASRVEFWPDYSDGPLWLDGRSADLEAIGVPTEVADRLRKWNDAYDDSKLPMGDHPDGEWLAEGTVLLAEVRRVLAGRFVVIVHEDWWGEPGEPFPQP